MIGAPQPLVVLIDDQRDEVDGLREALGDAGVAVEVIEPEHLTHELLEEARVFLVDMFLTDWEDRDRHEAAAQVLDGVALAGVIRAHARRFGRPMPIIALNTGHPDDIAELPFEIREHALARAHGLEWVFLKDDSSATVPTHIRVAELARADQALPQTWSDESAEQQLLAVLGGRDEELAEVLDCWPPIREMGRVTAGIGVLRWLLHRILPYPCFLLDARHIAARLGITLTSFRAAVEGTGRLADGLLACRYEGQLSGFDGPRWWRSRIESMLWSLSADGALPAGPKQLQEHTATELEFTDAERGVVVLDANYRAHDQSAAVADAVRIQLDDWPPYAEEAWALITEVGNDPHLRERVQPFDRARLP